MVEINHAFAQAVTSIAFNLTLSRNQIVALVAISHNPIPEEGGHVLFTVRTNYFRAMGLPCAAVPAGIKLERLGLVYAPDKQWPGWYNLTEAGVKVLELLAIAGIVQQIEEKVKEQAA